MYVFGGFNGQMLSDIQKLTPGMFKFIIDFEILITVNLSLSNL